jgi:hypothetical protein
MIPIQFGFALASWQMECISSGVLTVGLKTILTGIWGEASSALAMVWECVATCFNVSSQYKCWLPVTNQTSNVFKLGRLMLEILGVGIL